jgi:hypothetical protein
MLQGCSCLQLRTLEGSPQGSTARGTERSRRATMLAAGIMPAGAPSRLNHEHLRLRCPTLRVEACKAISPPNVMATPFRSRLLHR